jgi:hypothetical protein
MCVLLVKKSFNATWNSVVDERLPLSDGRCAFMDLKSRDICVG